MNNPLCFVILDFHLHSTYYLQYYLLYFQFLQNLLAEHVALDHHAWNVERTLEEVALGGLSHSSVAVEIAIPLAVLSIGEVGISPLADALVAIEILLVASTEISIERADDSLALRPPELHVLRIVLRRQVLAVAEVDDAAVLLVPSPVP